MLTKLDRFLNLLMGGAVGVFLGHAGYVCIHHARYPGLYAMQSAPWYLSIELYGIVLCAVLLLCTAAKLLIRHKQNRK